MEIIVERTINHSMVYSWSDCSTFVPEGEENIMATNMAARIFPPFLKLKGLLSYGLSYSAYVCVCVKTIRKEG